LPRNGSWRTRCGPLSITPPPNIALPTPVAAKTAIRLQTGEVSAIGNVPPILPATTMNHPQVLATALCRVTTRNRQRGYFAKGKNHSGKKRRRLATASMQLHPMETTGLPQLVQLLLSG
jgi:hypothetical protein